MNIRLRVNYQLLLSDFDGTWIISKDFRKNFQNIQFHENPSSDSRTDRLTWRR